MPDPEPAAIVEGLQQNLFPHLLALRSRLIKAAACTLAVLIALVPFANRLYAWLAAPLLARFPGGTHLIATQVASPFLTPLKLAMFLAVFVSAPVILYQLWAFVRPGLYAHEKRLARPLLAAAPLLLCAGCAFAFLLVLPAVFRFFAAVTPHGVVMMTDITHYLDFVLLVLFAFGACFEIPVVVVVLAAARVVNLGQLRRVRRYAYVAGFVVAAAITPPDITSMILLAVPMCLLYELGVLAARWLVPRSAAPPSGTSA